MLFIHSDAPPGNGLGSSSTMAVTLIGLVRQWLQKPWTNYDIAQLAYHIEREILGIKGGKQDQYAAAFERFHFIEFYRDYTVAKPLADFSHHPQRAGVSPAALLHRQDAAICPHHRDTGEGLYRKASRFSSCPG